MNQKRTKIAVVDDDLSVLKALRRLLKSVGFDVEVFSSPQEFRASPGQTDFACLIVDVRMPGESGLEFYRRLRDAGHRTPAIFISAHDDEQVRAQAISTGGVAFLLKPFNHHSLLDAIHKALKLWEYKEQDEKSS
jgi:FixJ family two-component response regulator